MSRYVAALAEAAERVAIAQEKLAQASQMYGELAARAKQPGAGPDIAERAMQLAIEAGRARAELDQAQAARNAFMHDARMKAGARWAKQVADVDGYDQRPDPLAARTPPELVAALRRYRIWAGEPSYRTMAARCRQMVAASTMCTALGSDALPGMDMVVAVITGCGGGEPAVERFVTAWRQIRLGQEDAGPAMDGRTLRVVPQTAEAG